MATLLLRGGHEVFEADVRTSEVLRWRREGVEWGTVFLRPGADDERVLIVLVSEIVGVLEGT